MCYSRACGFLAYSCAKGPEEAPGAFPDRQDQATGCAVRGTCPIVWATMLRAVEAEMIFERSKNFKPPVLHPLQLSP